MPQIGPAEILVVVLVGLLVFGPHRLPEVGRQVGHGLRELKKIQAAVKHEIDAVLDADGADSGDRGPESTGVR
jgi:TatA/E family protein of Tat protein translocase